MEGGVENSEIIVIPNQYKDTLDDLINSSDPESLDWMRPIDERSRNIPISEGSSAVLSERNSLNEDLSDRLSWVVSKTGDSHVRQCHVIISLVEYGKSQKGRKDHRGNKINPMVEESSGTKASMNHHVIDQY